MKSIFSPLFQFLYGKIPVDQALQSIYWTTAVIFFMPAAVSPLFFIGYWQLNGAVYAFTYGLIMLFVVWVVLPLLLRALMKIFRLFYNSQDHS
ncbi:hypothetical protein [Alkalicoccus halolimnae]|uniref:Uncharacterized protein n=1 Tax=Alkalicoccus halolimnae TaxID=1667239 RepID=A0A5C7FFU2_9BACI|nr:hypothetical protein [Alkalicoccus halolimnae]TXF85104.1 hypothetical protein FTX54_09790 [Alkalicoccus halolimnae]